jgi:cAMP-dependent protein kinase regulator
MAQASRSLTAEQYLAEKHVKQFLSRIVLSLLEARPDNIERHVMNLLLTSPPTPSSAQPKADADLFPSYGSPAENPRAPGKVGAPGPAPATAGRRQSTISPAVLQRSMGNRRGPIFSKMTSNTEVQIKVIPKDPATFAALEAATRKVDLFSFLQDEQRTALVNAMFKKEYKNGDSIITEGDQPDNFYIIESGECKVKKKIGNEQREVAQLGAGQYFGELALISGSTRAASIIACSDLVVCWAIDQVSYLGLLKEQHGQKRQRYRTLLRNVPFLKVLQDYEILLVADALRPVTASAGTAIVKQGDSGEDFFILLEGECIVRKSVNGAEDADVARLKPGAYFGEIALLQDCPRAATIVAASACKMISLDRKSFHRLLGPCSEIFKDNMKSYQNP